MPKVFIIEPVRQHIDVSKAQKFGDIIYVFEINDRRCSAFQIIHFGRTVLQRLEQLEFDPKLDFVCIVGAMLTVTIAIIAIAQRYDVFNVLLFNSVDDAYVEKRFDRNDWKGHYDGAKNRTAVRSS